VRGDDHRHERWILDRLDRARLVQQAVAAAVGERGAERIVDAGVVAEVERPRESRRPERDRGEDDDADWERVASKRAPEGASVKACRG
jgi:hypothetical protein